MLDIILMHRKEQDIRRQKLPATYKLSLIPVPLVLFL